MYMHSWCDVVCNCRRADTTDAVTPCTATAAAAGCPVDEDAGVRASEEPHVAVASSHPVATPVTGAHAALVGVRNAIDASYVSCQRHLSRRVTSPPPANTSITDPR